MAVPFLVLNPIFTTRKSISRDSVTVIGRSFQSFDEWGIVRILILRYVEMPHGRRQQTG